MVIKELNIYTSSYLQMLKDLRILFGIHKQLKVWSFYSFAAQL